MGMMRLACIGVLLAAWPASEPEATSRPYRKLLFLGNSITRHGPKPDIDWHGDWGMAATAPENDYVHRVTEAIARRTGRRPEVLVKNIAEFERGYAGYDAPTRLADAFAFDADLVVLAIGENVPAFASAEDASRFQAGVAAILKGLSSGAKRPRIAVRGCFWPSEAKDERLRRAAEDSEAIFVDIARLGRDDANKASSERPYKHAGVGAHPGDLGMKAIADAILEAVDAADKRETP